MLMSVSCDCGCGGRDSAHCRELAMGWLDYMAEPTLSVRSGKKVQKGIELVQTIWPDFKVTEEGDRIIIDNSLYDFQPALHAALGVMRGSSGDSWDYWGYDLLKLKLLEAGGWLHYSDVNRTSGDFLYSVPRHALLEAGNQIRDWAIQNVDLRRCREQLGDCLLWCLIPEGVLLDDERVDPYHLGVIEYSPFRLRVLSRYAWGYDG